MDELSGASGLTRKNRPIKLKQKMAVSFPFVKCNALQPSRAVTFRGIFVSPVRRHVMPGNAMHRSIWVNPVLVAAEGRASVYSRRRRSGDVADYRVVWVATGRPAGPGPCPARVLRPREQINKSPPPRTGRWLVRWPSRQRRGWAEPSRSRSSDGLIHSCHRREKLIPVESLTPYGCCCCCCS